MPDVGDASAERLQRAAVRHVPVRVARRRWAIEFHLAHGEWIRLLREHGFAIEALHELQAPAGAEEPVYYDFVTVEWARRWPAEEIWVARKA